MKIAIITDLHFGARGGSSVILDYQSTYFKEIFFPYCKEHNINTVLCGGDFTDNRNHLDLKVVGYLSNDFQKLLCDFGIKLYSVVGNHDCYYKNTNKVNSLQFMKGDRFDVTDNDIKVLTFGECNIMMVPWINNENYECIIKTIKEHSNKQNTIILGHFELKGAKMYANSGECEHGLDMSLFDGYKNVLSGHFHTPSVYNNIKYIGSLFYLDWNDYGDFRGFLVYDTIANTFELVKNDYSLFKQFEYNQAEHDCVSVDELKELYSDCYVKLHVNVKPSNAKYLDFVNKLNNANLLNLSITDNTIKKQVDIGAVYDKIKKGATILDYMNDYMTSNKDKLRINVGDVMNILYKSASESKIKEI